MKREVTLVIDRSGSMRDQKLAQAKEAALQVIAGLKEGEAFISSSTVNTVELFAPRPVLKDGTTVTAAAGTLKASRPRAGPTSHDALKTALEQPPTEGMLPIVLFLTDGLPTVGQTSEAVIRDLAARSNPHHRRIFTFGVAWTSMPHFWKSWQTCQGQGGVCLRMKTWRSRSAGSLHAWPGLSWQSPDYRSWLRMASLPSAGSAISCPQLLPDLFEGDQLIVLGQYIGQETVSFELTGRCLGKVHTSRFSLDPAKADKAHALSPLWASRKIAEMIDLIRQMGADGPRSATTQGQGADRGDRTPVHAVRHPDRIHGLPWPAKARTCIIRSRSRGRPRITSIIAPCRPDPAWEA